MTQYSTPRITKRNLNNVIEWLGQKKVTAVLKQKFSNNKKQNKMKAKIYISTGRAIQVALTMKDKTIKSYSTLSATRAIKWLQKQGFKGKAQLIVS